MSDTDDDIDIDAALRELIENGDAETMGVDDVTGEQKYRLTDKGLARAAALLVKRTENT